MKSRKQFITEPDDRRWLDATPRAAAAGGLVVVVLFGAMALLHPGERAAVEVDRAAPSSVSDAPVPPDVPATTMPPIAADAESYAAPESQAPTF